ncbi:MAG: UDP-glucose 4-epimerase GalE [Deltaproteobacteria bacterium]|nr:UDP-glucose 4-epimerase GalE [Deltaproteobacteria bacterium]
MKILCVGGAGYVGSATVRMLCKNEYDVSVLDNLSSGHRKAVPPGIDIYNLDYGDCSKDFLARFDAIFIFAGKIRVDESMTDPWAYWNENVFKLAKFIENVKPGSLIIYSSSAAVYKPKNTPISEYDSYGPTSVYGITKLAAENLLEHYSKEEKKIRTVCLRYFNAAGAAENSSFGESHDPETHFIPRLCSYSLGRLPSFAIFGNDWDTEDGTCVRDFVHINDLAKGHILALEKLNNSNWDFEVFNLGSGVGYSLKQVVREFGKIINKSISVDYSARREGDCQSLVADISKAKEMLGWYPAHDLNSILLSAWNWHRLHPNGYAE